MPDGTHMSNETLLHKTGEALHSRIKDVLGYRKEDLAYQHAAEARRDTLQAIRSLAADASEIAEAMEREQAAFEIKAMRNRGYESGDLARLMAMDVPSEAMAHVSDNTARALAKALQ